MASQKDSISGIEIRNGLITIAQYFPQENSVGSIIIKPMSDAAGQDFDLALKTELKNLITEIDYKNQNVALSLPSEYAIVKKLSLDSDEKDVSEAIGWELSQHIIGAIEEYSFDYEGLGQSADGAVKQYLAVAYRSSSIQKLVALLKANKLNPLVVDLDMFGLINVFEANYQEQVHAPAALVLGNEGKSTVILTRGATLLDFDVCLHDPGTPSADEYGMKIAESIERLCVLNGGSPQEKPDIYCAGSLFSQAEYIDSIALKFGKTQLLDPFKKIACRAGKGEEDLRKYSHQLGVAVGMALQGGAEL
jgi:Tfp pilus assembly PilM family ATPase